VIEDVLFVALATWQVRSKERAMRKYIVAAVLVAFVTPALALTSSVYYVGLDMTTHTCSVVTEMKPGMKVMGKYKSQKAAEKAMAGMRKCHA
jgi:hypothetical protein